MKANKEQPKGKTPVVIKPFWKDLQALYLIGVDPFPYPLKRTIKRWRTKYKHV